jgi:hypothetical protein
MPADPKQFNIDLITFAEFDKATTADEVYATILSIYYDEILKDHPTKRELVKLVVEKAKAFDNAAFNVDKWNANKKSFWTNRENIKNMREKNALRLIDVIKQEVSVNGGMGTKRFNYRKTMIKQKSKKAKKQKSKKGAKKHT